MLKLIWGSTLLTIAAVVAAFFGYGLQGAITTMILIAIELSFSFDNAVVNTKVLEKLSRIWLKLFMTVGMAIAIVGMRFVFPIVIVMLTADLSWSKVLDDALHHPKIYGEHLEAAHPLISSFGGGFLLTLSLYFFFDKEKEEHWIRGIEQPLNKIKGAAWLPPIISFIVLGAIYYASGRDYEVLKSGAFGIESFVLMQFVIKQLDRLAPSGKKIYTGWAAFFGFMYLQLLNSSFSFDGVLGAFAITDKVILIVLGLGVGALWAGIMTLYFVERGVIGTYKYLEHGAHYAILVLAIALFSSLFKEIPDVVTGATGIGIILASFLASREALRAKRH